MRADSRRGCQRPSFEARRTTAAADESLTLARALGYERRDIAALFEVLARMAGGESAKNTVAERALVGSDQD